MQGWGGVRSGLVNPWGSAPFHIVQQNEKGIFVFLKNYMENRAY